MRWLVTSLLMAALLAVSLAVLGDGLVPKMWKFPRTDDLPQMTIVIDYDGQLTLYEGERIIGRVHQACEPRTERVVVPKQDKLQ